MLMNIKVDAREKFVLLLLIIRSRCRLKRLRSEPTSRLRKNQNKEDKIVWRFKICSGKIQLLLLILVLPENKLLRKYQILVIY